MELNVKLKGNALSEDLQQFKHTRAVVIPPQVNQTILEKTKAEPEKQAVSEQETITAIGQANKIFELLNRDLRFEIHDETGIIQITVVDRNDSKVIKQIPPDSILSMIARIQEVIGSLVDVKA